MESDTSLVGTDSVVELHAVADVVLHLTLVVDPSHTECEDAVGLYHTLDDAGLLEFRMLVVDFFYAHQHFLHCLKILLLAGMLSLKTGHDLINVHVCQFRFLVILADSPQLS